MQLSQAVINGRSHRLMQKNGQDVAVTGQPATGYAFGLVLDGCGSKQHDSDGTTPSQNEVGANLLGQYAATFIENQLPTVKNRHAIYPFLGQLYRACVTYLDCVTTLIPWKIEPDRRRFINSRLLATLIGFVVTPETAVCFWAGDGYLCINDEIISLDSNNRPNYLAYQLLESRENDFHAATKTRNFNSLTIHNRPQLERLAVATDGWNNELLTQLSQPRPSLSLQRWINIQARQRKNFDDDGAAAIFYSKGQVARGKESSSSCRK